MNNYQTPEIVNGKFIDSASGLVVPRSYNKSSALIDNRYRSIPPEGWNKGEPLDRDLDSMVVKWPRKGSGWDDFTCDLIVDGNISNVGVAPVIAPMISALVHRQQNQAVAATIELTGRKTPVRLAREAISRFDDSPLGATTAMQKIVRNMRTHNRGQPIATVPIHYDMNQWEEYGMIAHEIKIKNKSTKTYYLEVDWSRFGTPVPFLPDTAHLEATGNAQWPYWYRARMDGKADRWVLLHHSQIIPLTPGESSMPGIGTSSVWMCLGRLAEMILVVDEQVEKKIASMAEGLIGIGPVMQAAEQIQAAIEKQAIDDKAKGNVLARGHHILTNPQKPVQFSVLAFRQHDGIEFKDRREEYEDTITACFDEPLTALVTRGGVGFGSQADTVADITSEGGVMGILNRLAIALGAINPTIQVRIIRPNDRANRLNIETFAKFATGVNQLHGAGDKIMSPNEIRGLIENHIFDIPETADNIIGVTATHDDPEGKERTNTDAPEQDEPTSEPKPEPEAPVEDPELSALLSLCRVNEWYLARMEPIVPEGADEPIPETAPEPENVATSDFDQHWPEEYGEMLEAEVVQTEAEAAASEGDSRWLWVASIGALLYLSRDGVRRVDREEAIEVRDTMPDQRTPDTDRLANLLATGVITLIEWNRLMKFRVEEAYANEGRLGRGGNNAMTAEDWAIMSAILAGEFEAIDDLTRRIGQGIYSEAQIANYSRNFIHGSVTAYERMNAHAHGMYTVLPQYPGDCQTQCCKGCKCSLSIRQLTGEQNFDVYWLLGRAEHCADCLRLNAVWSPLRIRNGAIQ
jgi:hypothetical protein